jgi:hypothetical protein
MKFVKLPQTTLPLRLSAVVVSAGVVVLGVAAWLLIATWGNLEFILGPALVCLGAGVATIFLARQLAGMLRRKVRALD